MKNGINKALRDEIIAILQRGENLPPDYLYDLFPSARKECELVYGGKAREEDILAHTMAVPLQRTRLFGNNGNGWHNRLIFGDNLQAMKSLLEMKKRGELCNADGTPGIRLVYIDPPFATKQELSGGDGGRAYRDKLVAAEFLEFLRKRLVFIHELLSDDGSVYVHLDWRMNAYVRVLMDDIFGKENFQREIIWDIRVLSGYKTIANNWIRGHETILFYSKSNSLKFNKLFQPHTKEYLEGFNKEDENGKYMIAHKKKRYLQDVKQKGKPFGDVWDDIKSFQQQPTSSEKVSYPTQKPETLLERIINASSNEGDLVVDAFCGSGTTCTVAEKLGRRWIGIDCGKLAIYTTQKRLLNLRAEIGNKGKAIKPQPFALYNAGLYDFESLRGATREEWRTFALLLFECRDKLHTVGGIKMDGFRRGKSVMIFNHHEHKDAKITEETIADIHARIGNKAGDRVYIIAPAMAFTFFQDYIDCGNVRYYALRIPYSIIHDLHRRDFSALLQPEGEGMVNESVDAVGFDFIHPPEIKYSVGVKKRNGSAFIKITTFKSEANIREPLPKRGNLETLSMLLLDYDYRDGAFEFDEVFFADTLAGNSWTAHFPADKIGGKVMAIFADIYGNEVSELITAKQFGMTPPRVAKKSTRKTTRKKK